MILNTRFRESKIEKKKQFLPQRICVVCKRPCKTRLAIYIVDKLGQMSTAQGNYVKKSLSYINTHVKYRLSLTFQTENPK